MPHHPVLAPRVEPLQHDQQRPVTVRVQQVLQLVHALDVLLDLRQRLPVRFGLAGVRWVDLRQADLLARFDDHFLALVHENPSRSSLGLNSP